MRRFPGPLAVALVAAAAVPARAAGGGEHDGDLGSLLVTPQFGTFFWTFVTFLVMLFILKRFAWGPILEAINSREEMIRTGLDDAKKQREDAEAALQEQKELLAEARRERAEAVKLGQQDAERLKEEILAEARQQREQLLKQTEEQIESSMRQARADLRSVSADLALRAAEKLIHKQLDDPTQRRLVEEYLADLEKGSDAGPLPS